MDMEPELALDMGLEMGMGPGLALDMGLVLTDMDTGDRHHQSVAEDPEITSVFTGNCPAQVTPTTQRNTGAANPLLPLAAVVIKNMTGREL